MKVLFDNKKLVEVAPQIEAMLHKYGVERPSSLLHIDVTPKEDDALEAYFDVLADEDFVLDCLIPQSYLHKICQQIIAASKKNVYFAMKVVINDDGSYEATIS